MTDNKRLKGAVLIMVMTFMFTLIIIVAATLAVVSTASQRAVLKYEENQAYYTARSALDVFSQQLLNDKDLVSADGVAISAKGLPATTRQGSMLQFELYKIQAQNTDYGIGANADSAVFTGATDDKRFSYDAGRDKIRYTVAEPKLGVREFGERNADGTDIADIFIDVEVLERKYNAKWSAAGVIWDGALATLKNEDIFKALGASATGEAVFGNGANQRKITSAQAATAIAAADRGEDYMRIKITASTDYNGVPGSASLEIETIANPLQNNPTQSGGAGNSPFVSMDQAGGGAGAQFISDGGMATLYSGVTTIGDGNASAGPMFTAGSLNWESSSAYVLGNGGNLSIMGDFNIVNSAIWNSVSDDAFIFVGGTFTYKVGGNLGTMGDSSNVSLITSHLDGSGATGPLNVNGNIYATKYTVGSQKATPTGNTYVKEIILPSGSIIEFGEDREVNIPSLEIANALRDSKIVLCADGVITDGSRTVNLAQIGLYQFKGNGNPVGDGWLYSAITYNPSSAPTAFDISAYTYTGSGDAPAEYKTYSLPVPLPGSSEAVLNVPTAYANFSPYFKPEAWQAWGELKHKDHPTDNTPTSAVNMDFQGLYTDVNKTYWMYTGLDMLMSQRNIDISGQPNGWSELRKIVDKTGAAEFPTSGFPITIPSGTTQYYWLGNGNLNSGNISGATYDQPRIEVEEGAELILIIPDNVTIEMIGAQIYPTWLKPGTFSYISCCEKGPHPSSGTHDGGGHYEPCANHVPTMPPNIYIYSGTGSKLKTMNIPSYIAGYINMPTSDIEWKLSNTPVKVPYTTCAGLTLDPDDRTSGGGTFYGYVIVGSVVCKKFISENQVGVAYLRAHEGGNGEGTCPVCGNWPCICPAGPPGVYEQPFLKFKDQPERFVRR